MTDNYTILTPCTDIALAEMTRRHLEMTFLMKRVRIRGLQRWAGYKWDAVLLPFSVESARQCLHVRRRPELRFLFPSYSTRPETLKVVPPKQQHHWTEQDMATLKQLRDDCASWEELPQRFEQTTSLRINKDALIKAYYRLNNLTALGKSLYELDDRGIRVRRLWTESEDARLVKLREDGLRWNDMSAIMGRTTTACKHRRQLLGRGLVKERRRFTREDDDYIGQKVRKYMEAGKRPAWTVIGAAISRSGAVVRERWERYLSPATKRTDWTTEEDAYIRKCITERPEGTPIR